ncbi:MAG: hypothetical protein NTZ64_07030 [Polaromonas sp.]|nr:hypothetical protein [Polaromonas sp.]
MRNDSLRAADDCAQQARQLHRDLLQATELQLHRAVDRAVEDYRRSRQRADPLALNLFPALRVRYGNLLNAQLLSAEMVLNQPEALIDGPMLQEPLQEPLVPGADGPDMAFFVTVAGVNDSEAVLWNAPDAGRALPRSLDIAELMAFVQALGDASLIQQSALFTRHAQSLLMSQASSQQALEQLADDMANAQGQAAFYKAAFEAVAEADKTPALATIYEALKSTYRLRSAIGTGSEAAATYWLELGEIAAAGSSHILTNLAQSEIHSDVRAALKALPLAVQLVLWQEHDGMGSFFDEDYRHAARASLLDDGDCVERIASKVCSWLMGAARDDWHSRAQEV